jgi:hypothetical protein
LTGIREYFAELQQDSDDECWFQMAFYFEQREAHRAEQQRIHYQPRSRKPAPPVEVRTERNRTYQQRWYADETNRNKKLAYLREYSKQRYAAKKAAQGRAE